MMVSGKLPIMRADCDDASPLQSLRQTESVCRAIREQVRNTR